MKKPREALFYHVLPNERIQCELCPHGCEIGEGGFGRCGVRGNMGGKLMSLNYGVVTAYGVDPVEKKPLYHFYPGSDVFSIGSFGCNFSCRFCQNWQIAHGTPGGIGTSIENLVNIAKNESNNIGLAYTYNEPTIWYEFIYEAAQQVQRAGLKNVLVTNGFIEQKPLQQILPYIDAMNIDLKGFCNSYYEEVCGGMIEPVKNTIERAAEKCHVEITTLIVTSKNDDLEEIAELSRWIASLDKHIPLHLNRYFPAYKMDLPPTSPEQMAKAKVVAKEFLSYVYLGNMDDVDRNTYCPRCKERIVEREHSIRVVNLQNQSCTKCGEKINIII